jgi:hypothetical protein
MEERDAKKKKKKKRLSQEKMKERNRRSRRRIDQFLAEGYGAYIDARERRATSCACWYNSTSCGW